MTSHLRHYLMKRRLIIILRGWRRGHMVWKESVTHRERIAGDDRKEKANQEREMEREFEWERKKRSKAGLSLFMPQKAPKRIRNNQALGLLSSLAIRLSWWSEWYEWQGSRPSPGFTQQGVFFPFFFFLLLSPLSGTNAAEIFPNEDNVVQGAKF